MMEKSNANKNRKWRIISLTGVYVIFGIHIAHWQIAQKTLAPLEINELLYTLHLGIINAGALFMAAAVLSTLIFGRFFCSWGCHMLALQDLSAWLLSKIHIKPKRIQSRTLALIPLFAFLYLFIWPQLQYLFFDSGFPGFRIASEKEAWSSFVTDNLWRNLPGPWISVITLLLCGFLIVYLLGSRSLCRFGCPWGIIFGAADRIAPGRIALTGNCIQCRKCTAQCDSGVRVHEEIKRFGMIINSKCLKDLNCVAQCPQQAIHFCLVRPGTFLSKTLHYSPPEKLYSFSLREDVGMIVLFVLFMFIFRGLYDAVPFILAMAVAVALAYFTISAIRLFYCENVKVSHLLIKNHKQLTNTGKFFSALMIVFFLFTTHSAFVHYHSYSGHHVFDNIAANYDDDIQMASLHQGMEKYAKESLSHLEKAYQWGLYKSPRLQKNLIALYLYVKNDSAAENHLREFLIHSPDDMEAKIRLGRIVLSSGRFHEAEEYFRQIINQNEKFTDKQKSKIQNAAYYNLGIVYANLGKKETAIEHYNKSLQIFPRAQGFHSVGKLQYELGWMDEAENSFRKAIALQPGYASAYYGLSLVLTKKGQNEKADFYAGRAVELDSRFKKKINLQAE